MYSSLNSLKGGYTRDNIGDYCRGGIEGDTRSVDYRLYEAFIGTSLDSGTSCHDMDAWLPNHGNPTKKI